MAASPLSTSTKIAPHIWLLPPINQTNLSSLSPTLAIILAWLDASPRHLKVHIAHYQSKHPGARIVVVMTAKRDFFLQSAVAQAARLEPLHDVVLAETQQTGARLLVHAFSNAGAIQLELLTRIHKERTGNPLPLVLTVLDSCPGIATFTRSVAALSVALPRSFLLRLVVRVAIFVYLGTWFTFAGVMRKLGIASQDAVMRARQALLDPSLIGKGRRLYIFSNADAMVGGEDVASHAQKAMESNWNVRTEQFSGTRHVGHVLGDAVRYWSTVEEELRAA